MNNQTSIHVSTLSLTELIKELKDHRKCLHKANLNPDLVQVHIVPGVYPPELTDLASTHIIHNPDTKEARIYLKLVHTPSAEDMRLAQKMMGELAKTRMVVDAAMRDEKPKIILAG